MRLPVFSRYRYLLPIVPPTYIVLTGADIASQYFYILDAKIMITHQLGISLIPSKGFAGLEISQRQG